MKALVPLSWLYRAGVALRNRYYDRIEAKKLPVPVVSVGNLTVGGSGKTPLVAALARDLMSRRYPVAVLSRGYRRESTAPFVLVSDGNEILVAAREGGDEPVELAHQVPGLVVAVGSDRYRAGQTLLEKLGPHVLLLDDGFQHRRLARDVDIVCFDCGERASSLELLPVGRLREPLGNVARAHVVALTRWSEACAPPPELGGVPAVRTVTRLHGFTRLDASGDALAADAFRGEPVALLAGIARPERIREGVDANVVLVVTRRDHHRWRADELEQIMNDAEAKGARAILTTGKDAVNMTLATPGSLPVYRIDVETEILDREAMRGLLTFPPL